MSCHTFYSNLKIIPPWNKVPQFSVIVFSSNFSIFYLKLTLRQHFMGVCMWDKILYMDLTKKRERNLSTLILFTHFTEMYTKMKVMPKIYRNNQYFMNKQET